MLTLLTQAVILGWEGTSRIGDAGSVDWNNLDWQHWLQSDSILVPFGIGALAGLLLLAFWMGKRRLEARDETSPKLMFEQPAGGGDFLGEIVDVRTTDNSNLPESPLDDSARTGQECRTQSDPPPALPRKAPTSPVIDGLRTQRTVMPSDVLVTKGEVQTIVSKELALALENLSTVVHEGEARANQSVADLHSIFQGALEGLKALQDSRERDVATIYAHKSAFESELAAISLKLKENEVKIAQVLLEFKDHLQDLARKIEGSNQEIATLGQRIDRHQADQDKAQNALLERLSEDQERVSGLRTQQASFLESLDCLKAGQTEFHEHLKELRSGDELLAEHLEGLKVNQTQAQQLQVGLTSGQAALREQLEGLAARQAEVQRVLEILRSNQSTAQEDLDKLESAREKLQDQLNSLCKEQATRSLQPPPAQEQADQDLQLRINRLEAESQRSNQRIGQVLKLLASIHRAVDTADSRTSQELDRLRSQDQELKQLVTRLLGGAKAKQKASSSSKQQLRSRHTSPLQDPTRPRGFWSRIWGRPTTRGTQDIKGDRQDS